MQSAAVVHVHILTYSIFCHSSTIFCHTGHSFTLQRKMELKTTSGGISLRPRTAYGTAVTTSKSDKKKKTTTSYGDNNKKKRGRPRLTKTNSKGKEEEDFDEEIYDDEIEDFEDDEDIEFEEGDDYEEVLNKRRSKVNDDKMEEIVDDKMEETATQSQINDAATINIAYMGVLLKELAHVRGIQYDPREVTRASARIKLLNERIEDTSHALEDLGLPLRRANTNVQIERSVAPIREQDGTEYRFTQVARNLGLDWSQVDDYTKQDIYTKAAQYHKDVFGAYPSKVKVWVKGQLRPMYYYNKDTYGPTMERALREFISLGL